MNRVSPILIDPYSRIWLPLVIFVVIYSIYYLITVQLYKGIVLPRKDYCNGAIYPAICRTVRPPPQNSPEAKKLGRGGLPVKTRLVRAD